MPSPFLLSHPTEWPKLRRLAHAAKTALLLSTLLFALVALGCAAGDGDDDDEGDSGENSGEVIGNAFTISAEANGDGAAEVEFEIPSDATKFSLVAESRGNQVRFEAIEDGDGNDFLSPGGITLSLSEDFFPDVAAANVPSRGLDEDLSSRMFRARVTVADSGGFSAADGASLDFRINNRADLDFNSGTLLVNFFYVGTVASDTALRSIITEALTEMRSILRGANIRLQVNEFEIDGPTVLTTPFQSSGFYRAASAQAPSPAVNLFFGVDLDESGVLGISGGIPGPAISTGRSAVAVGMSVGAGSDGEYSETEIRLLGETMAHEGSHFMGLFHPVDFSGSSVVATDPLPDTPSCSSENECEANDNLVRNIMYPIPVRDPETGLLIPQSVLTTQQSGVLNRYIAVD